MNQIPPHQQPPYYEEPATLPAAPRFEVCAIFSFIFGVMILPMICCLPAALFSAVIAIILGHISLFIFKRPPKKRGMWMAITGLTAGYLVIGFFCMMLTLSMFEKDESGLSEMDKRALPGRKSFNSLHSAIRTDKIDLPSGNTARARSHAKAFTEHLMAQNDETLEFNEGEFEVYCQLKPDRCFFWVNLASLLLHDAEEKELLGKRVWSSAQAALVETQLPEGSDLAVGTHGFHLFEHILLGKHVKNPDSPRAAIKREANKMDHFELYHYFADE